MIRYTVAYMDEAYDGLAREWLGATDREAMTLASHEIERVLQYDPSQKGEEVHEGLRRIIIAPLKAQFTAEENDRLVRVGQSATPDAHRPQASRYRLTRTGN